MTGAITHHDTANFDTFQIVRGNVTRTVSSTNEQRCIAHTTGGVVYKILDGYGHQVEITPDATKCGFSSNPITVLC